MCTLIRRSAFLLFTFLLSICLLCPALTFGDGNSRGPGGGIIEPPPPNLCRFVVPGDANSDGTINISDVVFLVNLLCHEGPEPSPLGNGDVNADCEIDLDDVYYLIAYIFQGGPPPLDCVCGAPTIGECTASCDYVVPGDANSDGAINIADVVFLVNLLCHSGPLPFPLGNGDVNADCEIDLDDVYYLIAYIFQGGPPPMDCVCGAPTVGECAASCDYVVPGDANSDGTLNISDVVFLVNLLCHNGMPPSPLGNGDVNADCVIDMDDVYYLIAYIFQGGPPPMDCVCGAPIIGDCVTSCDGVVPGDADGNGAIDISDVVFLVNLLCHNGMPPSPLGNGDVNADCVIDMNDVDHLTAYIFESGEPPLDCVCGNPAIGTCETGQRSISESDQGIVVEKDLEVVPSEFGLWQNQPNPFNPATLISFSLPAEAMVRLEIYNLSGEKVRTLVDGSYGRGVHTVIWDGTDSAGSSVSAGVYLYTITSNDFTQTRKMMLIK